ncbi:MAG TPA: RNase A-like domain-containing protein [Marmoricola sp.]|nr:RNase A-like domain-containing protein [Marmoricola sp.]
MAALARVAGEGLPGADPVWSGPAATAFGEARDEVGQRLGLAAGVAGRAAEALSAYARAVERAQAEVAACAGELAAVEAERQRRAVLVAVGLPDPGSADLDARWRAVQDRHERALEAYGAATGAAARVLDTVWGQVPAPVRGMGVGDRVTQGFRGFLQAFAVEPVQGVWALTGEALEDRQQWARTMRALPAAMRDQVLHPIRTGEEMLGLDAWGEDGGDWTHSLGITGGAVAGMVFGPVGRAGQEARLVEHAAEHAAEDAAEKAAEDAAEHAVERPPLQDLADTFDGVDLASHEANGGHTLKEHVDVSDDYLRRRLERRVASNKSAADMPDDQRDVSRFSSRLVAEEWITKTLEARWADVDRWLESSDDRTKEFDLPGVPSDIGVLLHVHPDGAITQMKITRVRVVLGRNEQGVFVRTAYPMIDP